MNLLDSGVLFARGCAAYPWIPRITCAVFRQRLRAREEWPMNMIDNLHGMLDRGVDSALLRYSLGHELLKQGDAARAIIHLQEAVKLDENYSAAWKVLGKALASNGQHAEAVDALRRGIVVAEQRGDVQAAKEMGVFRNRSERQLTGL